MPISPQDIRFHLSVDARRGLSEQTLPERSLGGRVAATIIPDRLFADMGAEANAERLSDYRCVFVVNASEMTLFNASVSVSVPPRASAVDLGTDPHDAAPATEAKSRFTLDPMVAPVGVTFAGIAALGDIGPGQARGVWVRRTGVGSPSTPDDTFTLRVTGETL